EQPSRTFGEMAAGEEDDEPEARSKAEAKPPAEPPRNHVGIEKHERPQRAEGGAEPVGAVDREIGAPADAGREELRNRRADRRIFAADARARESAEEREHGEAVRERGEKGGAEVERQRDEEEALTPESVRQPAEDERAGHRAGDVRAHRRADLGGRQRERIGI